MIIINDVMAARYWPGESPIGARLRLSPKAPWRTVVGVVGSVKSSHADGLQLYRPISADSASPDTGLLVATTDEPSTVIGTIKGQAWSLDPKLPLKEVVTTMEARLAGTLARPRFNVILLSIFAVVGLLLAAIGVYGVISYSVGMRTREIGVRMALGAMPSDIRRAVLGEALLLAGAGSAIGLAGAVALARFMQSLVFEVSPLDPLTLAAMVCVLSVSVVLAAWLPARRATSVDPMVALRAE